MKYFILCFFIIAILHSGNTYVMSICSNGVFKCSNITHLQICFNGQLISSKFPCPENTYCCETATDKICTDYPSSECYPDLIAHEKSESNSYMECTKPGKFPVRNASCLKYFVCTFTLDGYVSEVRKCPIGLFDPDLQVCSNTYRCIENNTKQQIFCTDKGKFALKNTRCTKYRLCTLTSNGYRFKEYECPNHYYFDPQQKRCSSAYICPETIKKPSTITSAQSIIIKSEKQPKCLSKGRFLIPNSDCKKYYQCMPISNGFDMRTFECKPGYKFNSNLQKCTTHDICMENMTKSQSATIETIKTYENTIPCKMQGKFAVPRSKCQSYLLCSRTRNGLVGKEYRCPGQYLFDPIIRKCSNSYICPELSIAPGFFANLIYNCTREGKFSVPYTKCKKYVLCTKTEKGFNVDEISCANGLTFDDKLQACSKYYRCNETSFEDTQLYLQPVNTSLCTKEGKYPFADCKSYLLCTYSIVFGFVSTIQECPAGENYNPILKKCSSTYECNVTKHQLTVTTGFYSAESAKKLDSKSVNCEFENETMILPKCVEEGRFPVLKTGCKKYVFCNKTALGFTHKIYRCPSNSTFNPDSHTCLMNYRCLEISVKCKNNNNLDTTISTTTTTEMKSVNGCDKQGRHYIPGNGCKKYLLCILTKHGFVSATYGCPGSSFFNKDNKRCTKNYICPEIQNDVAPELCTTIGNFSDPNDKDCTLYYQCSKSQNERLVAIFKRCCDNTYFDPLVQECSENYICYKRNNTFSTIQTQQNLNLRQLVNGRCTTIGRYLIVGTGCRNYTLCVINTDGITFRQINYVCPTTTVFNQAIQKCTNTYTCPENACFQPGRMPNPNVRDCSSFIDCVPIFSPITGMPISFSATVQYCQAGFYYNPFVQGCDQNYVCPVNIG